MQHDRHKQPVRANVLDQGGKLVALNQRKQVGERVKLAYLHRRCSCCLDGDLLASHASAAPSGGAAFCIRRRQVRRASASRRE